MTKGIALLLLASTAACGELSYAPPSGAGGHRSNDPSTPSAPSAPTPVQPAQGSQVNQQGDTQSSSASTSCPGAAGCDRLVFLSSKTYDADHFHSALAADAECNALAQASDHAEIRARTFRAWVSDATTWPTLRFVRSTTTYRLPNGDKVADDFDDLVKDGLESSIDIDENGDHWDSGATWTGTRADGTATQANCSGWAAKYGSGTKGDISRTGSSWTEASGSYYGPSSDTGASSWNSCQSESAHIYCFEQ